MTADQGTMDQAKEAATTAADEGKHVAGVAKDEAQEVVRTAAEQARSVAADTVTQVRDQLTAQTSGQRDRLVEVLTSFGDDLDRMAGQAPGGGLAVDLAREAADRARALRQHLDGREPGQLLDDVRDFARRRPGMFLMGAMAAGVVAGRLLRGAADGAGAATLAEPEPAPTTTPPTPVSSAPVAGAPAVGAPVAIPTVPPTIEAP